MPQRRGPVPLRVEGGMSTQVHRAHSGESPELKQRELGLEQRLPMLACWDRGGEGASRRLGVARTGDTSRAGTDRAKR
jgi:hypothetical protein